MILHGDALTVLKTLPDESVHCCVTSPPYWGLRDYGTARWEGGDVNCSHSPSDTPKQRGILSSTLGGGKETTGHRHEGYKDICGKCGAIRVDGQLGLEKTPEEYTEKMTAVFREVRRVLRPDGTLWLNLGDSYNGSGKGPGGTSSKLGNVLRSQEMNCLSNAPGLKPKDLIGIPWRVAFALQADGWYLRQDIIWHKCLSGGTVVYARTQKGEMPMLVKDMVRLDPSTVELWNGEKWTRCVSWTRTNPDSERKRKSQQSRSARYRSGLAKVTGDIEIELINGQKIGCTKEHRWPTLRGVVSADQLKPGDILQTCTIPEPEHPSKPENLDDWIGWFIGLYIAEGSRRPDGCIQIASHMKETGRFERLQKIAASYGGTCRMHQTSENGGTINVYSPVLCGILDLYVSGKDAKTKHLSSACWGRSNTFLRHLINSYLEADAHYDEKNRRYKLGFCKNDNLSTDLRTLAARLGYSMRLHRTKHKFDGREFDGWRGDCVFDPSRRRNPDTQIRSIRQSRARVFWDIAVEDEPHLFALACGTLTHNSNPMPESVTDRCTKAHEYIFLLSKSERYFYDNEAIKVPVKQDWGTRDRTNGKYHNEGSGLQPHGGLEKSYEKANRRSVWSIPTKPYKGAHFATFPPDLIEPCILAGCPEGGTVLDPFFGSGTTGLVCSRLNRQYIGIELNEQYCKMAERRIEGDAPLLNVGVLPL
jgi:DNA modification methylase